MSGVSLNKITSYVITQHLILLIQIATIIAEIAEKEVGMVTETEAVLDEVVAGVLLFPSLPTISVSLQTISGPPFYKGGHS